MQPSDQTQPMDSATVGVVAFAAAIGFSVTEILFWHRRRSFRYALAMVVSVGAVLGFTRYVAQPYLQSSASVRLGASQLLAAIERLEPAKRFGVTIAHAAAASPAELRRRSMGTMTRHIDKSSDATVVELAKTLLKNAQALQRQDPSVCVSYLLTPSDVAGADYTRYLDESAVNEEVAALAGALESAANSTRAVTTTSERERGLSTLRQRLSDRYTTSDFERFVERRSFAGRDRPFICRMAIDQYREALRLPPPQRAAVLRHLMSASGMRHAAP